MTRVVTSDDKKLAASRRERFIVGDDDVGRFGYWGVTRG